MNLEQLQHPISNDDIIKINRLSSKKSNGRGAIIGFYKKENCYKVISYEIKGQFLNEKKFKINEFSEMINLLSNTHKSGVQQKLELV